MSDNKLKVPATGMMDLNEKKNALKFTKCSGDSSVTDDGRQRAGADNPTKGNENETVISDENCDSRTENKAKFGSKCSVDENNENDEKIDDLELKLKQSLNCGQEICPKCLSSSSIQKVKCGCSDILPCEQTDFLTPKCSCHELYQSANNNSTSVDSQVIPRSDSDSAKESEVTNCDALRAGMDPRCKAPPRPPPKTTGIEPNPEGHEFAQHFKYRHVDKDACGTYDIIELDTAENLTKMLAPGASGGNQPPPNADTGGGGVSNDLDHTVHLKYRNVDKSCFGEFDLQEGEHIDVRKIILPGQCMRGGMDKLPDPQSFCLNDEEDDCTKRLRSGMDDGWKYNSLTRHDSNSDLGYSRDKVSPDYPLSYSGVDLLSVIGPRPSTSKIYRLRAGMDQGNQEFTQKLKYRFADKTICGTYDIVEMETLEDLKLIGPPKPPQSPQPPSAQFQPPCPRHEPSQPTCAACRSRGGLDTAVHSLNSKMDLSEKSEDGKGSTSVKTEHLRAGMDCIASGSFASRFFNCQTKTVDI